MDAITSLNKLAHFSYIRQGEPVALLLGDDVIKNELPALEDLMKAYEAHQKTIIGVQKVSLESAPLYGMVE